MSAKKIAGALILLIVTVAWLVLTTRSFYGLNSIQQLIHYRRGLAGMEAAGAGGTRTILTGAYAARICVDTLDIPHIFAEDDLSLAYAVGYMHARDRYFQMELLTHMVTGRLSEIIGEAGLYSDRRWRAMAIEDKAQAVMDSLARAEPGLVAYLKAYAQGINDYIGSEDPRQRDPLYLCWDYSPQPWKIYYPLLIQWYMSFDLTYSDNYVNRQELLDKLPPSVLKALFPSFPDDQPRIIPIPAYPKEESILPHAIVHAFTAGHANSYEPYVSNMALGSNSWVVGQGRTEGAETFLCNDLHLFLASPNIFYEMQLNSPTMQAYGFTIPGVPLVVTGQNKNIAWGITNGGWDVTEQYLLRTSAGHPGCYLLDGAWKPFTKKQFTINVKDKPPVEFTAQYAQFGPVTQKDSLQIACLWHPALGIYSIRSFWKLARAGDWQEFRSALRYYDYPAQNFSYADTKGNMGMICAGKMPLKPAGYAGGLLDGKAYTPPAYIPFDSLPSCYNPSRGYLFSANQEPERGRYYFGSDWFEDLYRPARINELLSRTGTGHQLGLEDVREMQLDVTDRCVKDLQQLLAAFCRTEDTGENWRSMAKWDGKLTPDKKEAWFYKAFRDAAWWECRDIAGELDVRNAPSFDQFMHFLLTDDSVSFNGRSITARNVFRRLMKRTDSTYAARSGNPFSFSIPQMTFLPGFGIQIDDLGGSENTIDVNYREAHPVVRTIVQIKDGSIRSWMVNAIGQTGRMNAPGYQQQLGDWKENKLHETQLADAPDGLTAITGVIIFKKTGKP